MSESKLKVSGLWKGYGATHALKGVDLEVGEGEFVTLLGPSGSGKTTLLMAVAGLVEADRGEIFIDGVSATHTPPFKRDIGVVFQSYALFPHMSTAANIAFPLAMRGVPKAQRNEAVRRALDMVQLSHLADRYPDQLSGGQQQRVALARAVVYEPSIVLMDEPLGALDMRLRDHLRLEIKRLQAEMEIAVLYVTHDQEEAMVMSDRICLIADGTIAQVGTPDELYFSPDTAFVADFLGESNLLPGHVTGPDGSGLRVRLDCGVEVRGVAKAPMAVGSAVFALVRPESIRVLGDGEAAENAVEADVGERVMTGDTVRVFYELEGGTRIRRKALTAGPEPVGRTSDRPRVRLGWSRARTVILARD